MIWQRGRARQCEGIVLAVPLRALQAGEGDAIIMNGEQCLSAGWGQAPMGAMAVGCLV